MAEKRPDILFLMCDQFRFDCLHALGNDGVRTPNLDRLARQSVVFDRAYSTCPVCVPARYTLRTGCEPYTTGCYANEVPAPMDGLPEGMEERCGPYLARTLQKSGYNTFGIGKFHTHPVFKEDLGYDVHLSTEELWNNESDRQQDAFLQWLRQQHPEYAHVEQPHGERTNMYYVPQTSPLPAECTVESFVADRTVEQLQKLSTAQPFFGFVSFVGPHPPFAPPVPFNRLYNPDEMPNPVCGSLETDHMDEQIPWMNRIIWADELNDFAARNLRSRYYGEITYIDGCIGRILDAVEARGNFENTLICFFADHGDHLGDHHAWQKESYFEAACRVPLLLCWPQKYAPQHTDALACLTDLFGVATTAAGTPELRDGWPLLQTLNGESAARETLLACYGRPGTSQFKLMLRSGEWKYIYLANGGREQLFCTDLDPQELHLCNAEQPGLLDKFRSRAVEACRRPGLLAALQQNRLRSFEYAERPRGRIHQFDLSADITDFGQL